MKTEIRRYLITSLLCFILVGTVPTMTVCAKENEEPNLQDIINISISKDKDYIYEYQDQYPTTVIMEVTKAIKLHENEYCDSAGDYISIYTTAEELEPVVEEPKQPSYPTENCLNPYNGVYEGPSGHETYYNLDMSGVIEIMRGMGYSEADYPYWIREDGVKMFGPYVMVAASLDIRPKGTILPCSLGEAIVVDTGGFAYYNQTQLDIAVNW